MAIRLRQQDFVRFRIQRLFWAVALCYIGLVGRLVYLQAIRGDYFMGRAQGIRGQTIQQASIRGGLLDRTGKPLAVTIHTSRLVCDPTLVVDPDGAASAISQLCGAPVDYLRPLLSRNQLLPNGRPRRHVVLQEDLSPEAADAIRRAARSGSLRGPLRGVAIVDRAERSYPSGSEAVHVTGFLVPDSTGNPKGMSGLELALDRVLDGEDGRLRAEVDARGRVIPDTEVERVPVSHGLDARLTLDSTVQHITESELAKCTAGSKPVSATAIVLDPKTGEVLAMVSYPDYDPVRREGLKKAPESLMNRAISLYEPGSTLKVITVASAIEQNIVSPSTIFNCGGTFQIGKRSVKCAMHGGSRAHGTVDMKRLIEESCNVSSAQIGIKMGMQGLHHSLTSFGLLEQSGIGLPYEMRGRLGFGADALAGGAPKAARVAFGQAVMVTPLGLAAAYGAIANGGELRRPRLIDEYLDPSGSVVRREPSAPAQRAISARTADLIRGYMEAVVSSGTAKAAQVPGYRVAGKTGTAQKVVKGQKGYSGGKYVASFIGFLPARNPRAVIAVVVDEPRGGYYGGQVAAPVFQRIAQRLMWYWKVPPDDPAALQGARLAQR